MNKMAEEKKLNKFEETRLYSARALELAEGDKPKIKTKKGELLRTNDYVRVAKEEEKKGKLDLEIYEK